MKLISIDVLYKLWHSSRTVTLSPLSQLSRFLALVAVIFLVLACSLTRSENAPAATPIPPTPTSPPVSVDGWQSIANGIELRVERVRQPYTPVDFDMTIVRLDPAQVTFRVHYARGMSHTFSEWREQYPDAQVIVNASFFTPELEAVGLVFSDGVSYGFSLEGYGGMFWVSGDTARVRSLVAEPYSNEAFDQAVQGFPMLVNPGGQPAPTGEGFDTPSRRTMIAQDSEGRILFLVNPLGQLTLRNAGRWLLDSDLNIDAAFGLDGGKSMGLYLGASDGELLHPSFDPIPVVIAVYSR